MGIFFSEMPAKLIFLELIFYQKISMIIVPETPNALVSYTILAKSKPNLKFLRLNNGRNKFYMHVKYIFLILSIASRLQSFFATFLISPRTLRTFFLFMPKSFKNWNSQIEKIFTRTTPIVISRGCLK